MLKRRAKAYSGSNSVV